MRDYHWVAIAVAVALILVDLKGLGVVVAAFTLFDAKVSP